MSEEKKDKNDEITEQYETVIDWDSLLDAANDPEIAELLQSPIDNAINILKTGREIQKLSVIRTLSDLLETDGEQVVEKVMPLLQQILDDESSNLDMHCEAAITYKNIYLNNKLTSRFPAICSPILNGILQNAAQQKDNLSAAAWLETLVEVIDQTPTTQLQQLVVPLAVAQAETSQRAQRRVLATKLIGKLCTVLQPVHIRHDIMPSIQMLCKDPNSNVRSSIAQRLGNVAESLRNPNDSASVIVPCLVELCRDTDNGTREAALNTIAQCIPFLSRENLKSSIIPLLKQCTEQAIQAQDETLGVVAKNLGQWMYLLKDIMTTRDSNWFFDTYVRITNLASDLSSDNLSSIQVAARRMCAYNFPCMVLTYGKNSFKNALLPILEGFCTDPDDDVRSATAAGFHQVVKLVPNEPALISPFIELIRGSAAEVVGHLTGNLDRILPPLYKCVTEQNTSKIDKVHLNRIIIGCYRSLRGSSSWRAQFSFLQNIAVLRHIIPVKDLFISFVPLLKQEVLTTRAIPCRIAASITLLLFMRENPNKAARKSIIDFFVHTIAKHPNCHRRRLFLDIIPDVTVNFSRKFFHEHFLAPALEMSNDKVTNIRLQLCHTLTKIKANLYLPEDEEILQQLEGIIRGILSKEQNYATRQLIQTYAFELSRVETRPKSDKSDQLKEKAEEDIWSLKVQESAIETIESGVLEADECNNKVLIRDKSIGRLHITPWRTQTQYPKTAVVRPQPHVIVTQRSPSPMPRHFHHTVEERQSKLPLANSQINKSLNMQRSTAIPRNNIELPGKIRSPSGCINSNTLTSKSSTGIVANKPPASSIMSRSTPSPKRPSGLMPSRSTTSVRPLGQGLVKVRSFSNISRTPTHLKVKTIN